MVITDLAQFELLVQEVRDQILSESQGVGEVDIVDNLDNIYSLPALKLNDNGDQVVEAPLSLLSAPAEEAAALARAAAYDANTAAESANSAASSANLATDKANEATSNAQSATQQAESSADKANTAAQNADEATAQVLSGESERVEAENARQAAETERQSAEEERKSAEEARKLAEQSRELAESSRVSAEESRITAESERVTAESNRVQAETERVLKESERESAELTRQLNETTRQSNEDTRVQLEQTRLTNEEQRVSAESSRETEYADLKQRSDALIDDNEAAIENANTAAENANAAIANMENTYAKKDEIPDVSEFITTSVDNLVNYYRKSETYNLELINSLIGSITTINFKIVDSLPGTGENNLIYLVPSSKQEENNVKDEYIWIDNSWELIGSTKINLSNYYTRDEVNSTFALKTELAWDTITGKPVWIGSSKPTYTWSEINEKPTTISGYGITDAFTKTESDGRYVNTTGDTMTGNLIINGVNYNPLELNSLSTTQSIIVIKSNSLPKTTIGWVDTYSSYIYDSDTSKYINFKSDSLYWNNQYSFLHTGNYTSTLNTRYVKKSGDTMTGSLTINSTAGLFFITGEDTGARIFRESNNSNLWIQTNSEASINFSAHNGLLMNSINLITSNATVNGNKIWHASNDGSGSGLDADLLDGVHNGSLTAAYTHDGAIRANRLITKNDNRGWPTYFIIADCTDTVNASSSGKHYGFAGIIIEKRTHGYINEYINRVTARVGYSMYLYSLKSDSDRITPCILKKGSNYYLALKSLGSEHQLYLYGFEINLLPTFTQINAIDLKGTPPDGYSIAYSGSGMDFFGNITSATKLQTPRTIWGQRFDGTANVSGDMYNVGGINASGVIKTAVDGAAYYFGPDENYIGSNAGGKDFYIWGRSEYSFRIGTNNTEVIRVTKDGNVGIGTVSPLYKVDVTGDIRATGNIIGTVSSDIQLKTILNTIDYQDKLLSLGDVVEYEYNEIAFDRSNSSTLLRRTYTGLVYLNVKDVLPSMAYEDLDGYGCLNYLSYDYINLIAGALQLTITKLKQLEKRISVLEEENINLKLQLSN